MNHVFGPVPSRRLGQSLGIDTIPLKTCNWNCVYCQLGRTMPLTNERRGYAPVDEILLEAEQVLRSRVNGEIDWVTFVGSGERGGAPGRRKFRSEWVRECGGCDYWYHYPPPDAAG